MQVYRVVTNPAPGFSALAELVDPDHPEDLEELISLRNETDEVARSVAIAAISQVRSEDRYFGSHAAIVMAPFLWLAPSRFSPGTYGVLYTALRLETAIAESAYHAAEITAASIGSPAAKLPRVALSMELGDKRHADYRWIPDGTGARGRRFPDHVDADIYDPLDYRVAQAVGSSLRAKNYEGVRYNSVRDEGGECFGTFRPAAVQSVHDQVQTIEIEWDGVTVRSYNLIDTHYLGV